MSLFNPCKVLPTQNQPLPLPTSAVNNANDLHLRITALVRKVTMSVKQSLPTKSSSSVSLQKEDIESYENQITKLINEICESKDCTDPSGKFLNIHGENAMRLLKQIQETLHFANDDASISQSENTPVNNFRLNSSSSSFFAKTMPSVSAFLWPSVSTNIVESLVISTPKINNDARLSDENKGKVLIFLKTVPKLSSEEKEVQYESRYKEMESLLKMLKDTKTTPECKVYINALNLIRDDLSKTTMHKLMMLIKPVSEKISTDGIFRLSDSKAKTDAIDAAFKDGKIEDLAGLLNANKDNGVLLACGLKRAIKGLDLLSSDKKDKLLGSLEGKDLTQLNNLQEGKSSKAERSDFIGQLQKVFSHTDASYTVAKKAQTREVIKLLNFCSQHKDKNQMNAKNLAICASANFCSNPGLDETMKLNFIFEFVIQNYEAIFEDKNP